MLAEEEPRPEQSACQVNKRCNLKGTNKSRSPANSLAAHDPTQLVLLVRTHLDDCQASRSRPWCPANPPLR